MATGLDSALDLEERVQAAVSRLGCSLKPLQAEAVMKFITGTDVLVSLPTGYGKSLCFQCLPYVFNELRGTVSEKSSIIIVVSPLISIMKNQVSSLQEKGMSAGYICQDTSSEMKDAVEEGKCQIVYFSPETFTGKQTLEKSYTVLCAKRPENPFLCLLLILFL